MDSACENSDVLPSFGNAPGDLVVVVDPDGLFLFVNAAYCKLFGRERNELTGKWFMPLVHEDDRQHTEDEMRKLWEPPHSCHIEQRAMTVEGWRWIEWRDFALLDKQGNITEIVGLGRDITGRM